MEEKKKKRSRDKLRVDEYKHRLEKALQQFEDCFRSTGRKKKKKTNERLGDKVEWEKPKACSKYT